MCDKLQRAQDAWNLVMKDPASFGKVARERSIEPTSKALDGQIQPVRRYAGNDNLEKAAFELEEGHISGIIDVSTPEVRPLRHLAVRRAHHADRQEHERTHDPRTMQEDPGRRKDAGRGRQGL